MFACAITQSKSVCKREREGEHNNNTMCVSETNEADCRTVDCRDFIINKSTWNCVL